MYQSCRFLGYSKSTASMDLSLIYFKPSTGNACDITHLYRLFTYRYIRYDDLCFYHTPSCIYYLPLPIDGLHHTFRLLFPFLPSVMYPHLLAISILLNIRANNLQCNVQIHKRQQSFVTWWVWFLYREFMHESSFINYSGYLLLIWWRIWDNSNSSSYFKGLW